MSYNPPPPGEGGEGITSPPGPHLPAGWIQAIGSNGYPYYYHPASGQAQYAPPYTAHPPTPLHPTHTIDPQRGAAADASDAISTGAASHRPRFTCRSTLMRV
jgi:hypothetical protein